MMSSSAFACLGFPKQVPLEWLLEHNRKPIKILLGIILGVIVVQCGATATAVAAVYAVVAGGLCALAWLALCTVHRLQGRASAEMCVIVGLFLAIVTMTSAAIPFTEDFTSRTRQQAANLNLLKPFPAILGFPLSASACCMLWAFLGELGAYEVNAALHGDPKEWSVYINFFVTAFAWFGTTCLTACRLRVLYELQEALAVEKSLKRSLIAMLCDACVWLSEDGSTIVRADFRLEAALGRGIVGEALSGSLTEAEQQRFQEGVARAKAAPVLLPTTLVTGAGAAIKVDMFIVGNHGGGSDLSPAFLIGIRYATRADSEVMREVNLRQEHASIWAEGLAEQHAPAPGDAQSALSSLPTTTATGKVFQSVGVEEVSEGDYDVDVEAAMDASVRASLERVASLGRTEGWLIPSRDVKMAAGHTLGTGSFGQVGCGSLYGSPVAVKTVREDVCGVALGDLTALANEIRILRHARHPNIVTFHGICWDAARDHMMLVLAHIQGPNLYRYVRGLAADSQADERRRVLLDVSCALWYLHEQRPQIIHGDLKDTNILVEQRVPRAQLLDFGLSRCRTKSARALGGSLGWMAPEVILARGEPKTSADVFSFGRVALMVVTSRKPLEGIPAREIVDRAKRGCLPPVFFQPGRPLHRECASLCKKVLTFAPEQRPSMAEVHHELQAWAPPVPVAAEGKEAVLEATGAGRRAGAQLAGGGAVAKGEQGGRRAVQGQGGAESALVLPTHRPTAEPAKKVLLLETAMSWNFPLLRGYCCHYHAAVAEIRRVGEQLHHHECSPFLGPCEEFQCSRCGVLSKEFSAVCPVCLKPALNTASSLTTLEAERQEPLDAQAAEEETEGRDARPETRCSL